MNRTDREQLANRLLVHIRTKPKQKFRLAALAKRFKKPVDDIGGALRTIREWGYRLNQSGNAVEYIAAPDILSATEISHRLRTKLIGKKIHSYNSVKSTNDIAAQMAEKSASEGAIITAEKQTLGRGRLGRSWHSPAKLGIYLSIILRPKFPPDRAPGLSVMTALAVAETISQFCEGNVQVKWPNDVLINNRKVAGVLMELSADRKIINHVIVGVGINVNQKPSDFPMTIRKTATSIRRTAKKRINRVELVQMFLVNFEKEYLKYKKHGLTKSLARIRRRSSLIGKRVTIRAGNSNISGTAADIDSSGALILEQNSRKITVTSGEVTLVE